MLIGIVDRILPFPPGCYWKDGEIHRFRDIAAVDGPYVKDSLENVSARIRTLLIRGVEKRLDADAPLGFLLSGGLDSSLVASIASRLLGKKIRTFSIGMDADSIDSRYAEEASSFIGSDHTDVKMSRDEVISALPMYVRTFEMPGDPLQKKYPLQCFGYHGHGRTHSTYHNVPWLREVQPDELLINPIDAKPRGIADGTDTGPSINTLTTPRHSPLAKANPQHTNLVEVKAL